MQPKADFFLKTLKKSGISADMAHERKSVFLAVGLHRVLTLRPGSGRQGSWMAMLYRIRGRGDERQGIRKGRSSRTAEMKWCRMKRRRTARGFSLIELLIAMALVAIVAAIAVPQFQRYATNADLKTAAREVASDFFNTRQQALKGELEGEVKKDLDYRLTFNVGGNSYALETKEPAAAAWDTVWTRSFASFGGGITIHSINFSGGSVVNFQKRGTLSSWGDLILRNGRDSRATVTVNSTGRTYVTFAMQ